MESPEFREEWRVISRWTRYEVSNLGRVRRRTTGQVLKLQPVRNLSGTIYWRACLYRRAPDGHTQRGLILIHRLVASAFLPPPAPDQTVVHHRDTDTSCNCADNLEWATSSYNNACAWETRRAAEAGSCWSDEAPF